MKLALKISAIYLCLVVLLTSCNSQNTDLIGTWWTYGDDGDIEQIMKFNADNSMELYTRNEQNRYTEYSNCSYKLTNKKIQLISNGEVFFESAIKIDRKEYSALMDLTTENGTLNYLTYENDYVEGLMNESKIPVEFWDMPLFGINKVLENLYYATQGKTAEPFSIDPTPEILFHKLTLFSKKQMDGTTIQTYKGKTNLSGDTVSFELKTYKDSSLMMTTTLYILCNFESKKNILTRMRVVPTDGETIDLSISSYDIESDYQAAYELSQFFGVWSQLFNLWYSSDSVAEFL